MKNKLLLIIDPQIDFITGTLPVPGAESAMDALADYIHENAKDYAWIIVTADRHPMRHCSFKSEGGEWNAHCVADSVGAAIWGTLMNRLLNVPDKVTILHKGENADTEEYSIFKNRVAAKKILEIVETEGIRQIDICGLAGDICVADTAEDALRLIPGVKLNILIRFSPSIDGGERLNNLILRHGLDAGVVEL